MHSAVVVLVESTRFTFKANGAPVDIARHVVVQTDNGTQVNWRIDIRTPTVLNSLDNQLIYPARESQPSLKKYSELVHFLLDSLRDRYFVFYDQESTLEALRLALPRDRSVDVGLHVLLRNDALMAGGTIWNRSRSRLALLKGLWEPILRTHVLENLVDRARGIMQLFKNFGASLAQPTTAGAAVLTATDNWRSRPGTELSLEDSLLLELESGASVERRRREAEAALEIINEPQRGSAPFHFVLRGAGGINKRRVEALNALLKLVPHAGLALLNMLLQADLIASHAARVHPASAETHQSEREDRLCGRST